MVKYVFASLLILSLGACTTMPAKQSAQNEPMPWKQRSQQLNSIEDWNIQGAMSIHTREQSSSASLTWKQSGDDYHIHLFGPMGAGHIDITGSPKQVTLKTSSHKTVTADTPEALMQGQLGWHLPVTHLMFWIRGLPAPDLPVHKHFDPYHHLDTLDQEGWHIAYKRYTAVGDTDLPTKIDMHNDELNVRIVIKDWKF